MTDAEHEVVEARTDQHKHKSPFSPGRLLDLLIRPSKFFGYAHDFDFAWLRIAAWVAGLYRVAGRMDFIFTRAELGGRGNPVISMGVAESWPLFWGFLVVVGLTWTVFLWFVGAWWYRVRLRFSGARNADWEQTREAYFYSLLVSALPSIATMFVVTAVYSSYSEYRDAPEMWSSIIAIFPLWGCFTSYKAANVMFEVSRWKSRIWFLLLPLAAILVASGALAYLYAMI